MSDGAGTHGESCLILQVGVKAIIIVDSRSFVRCEGWKNGDDHRTLQSEPFFKVSWEPLSTNKKSENAPRE